MKKEHKFLIYSLLLSALCGSIALIVDQIAIQQESSTFYLKVDTDSIGYVLETDDEILAWGKFNS